jgi:ubiquinone/menaquinone biosynthesis C-methylase UbiE
VPEQPFENSVEDMYADPGLTDQALDLLLDASLSPRGPDMLFDMVGELGIGPAHRVLDVGCRDGKQAFELARRFGCRVFGVELVEDNLDSGRGMMDDARENEPEVAALVHLVRGRIETIPFPDETFDLVWARDMLIHIPDLAGALKESRRVLGEGGNLLVFQMFATPWLEPEESNRLWPPLAAVPQSADPEHFERCVAEAGFRIIVRDEIRSEWREYLEETGPGRTSRQLLHAARLLRDRGRFVEALGRSSYEVELANALWGVYQMVGKLSARVYILA